MKQLKPTTCIGNWRFRAARVIVAAIAAISFNCGGTLAAARPVYVGTASWYGEAFRGRPTASGERFNPEDFTAAHPSLPFGSRLNVTLPSSGASIVVRVNDRMPTHTGRAVDLSRAAADALGITQAGLATVRIELLPDEPTP